MRREFIANVSHELRTPLTTITGFVESLLDGTVSEDRDREKYLDIVRKEAGRMSKLINDLLDLSRLESGRLDMNCRAFSLKQAVETVIERLEGAAREKNVIMETNLGEVDEVYGERERIEQVLSNLVENAIRSAGRQDGGKGKVNLGAGKPAESGRVEVFVEDNGPGIPPGELPLIWERFYRAEKSRDRNTGSTGLGLAIARQVMEAHGEKIWAANAAEGGAVFTFTLPPAEKK